MSVLLHRHPAGTEKETYDALFDRPRRLARSIVAATLATVAIGAAAHDNERGRHRLPQLAPATPGTLVGTCEDAGRQPVRPGQHHHHRRHHDVPPAR